MSDIPPQNQLILNTESQLTYRSYTPEELYSCIIEYPQYKDLDYATFIRDINVLIEKETLEYSIDGDDNESLRLPSNYARTRDNLIQKMLDLETFDKILIHNLIDRDIRFWTIVLGAQKTKTAQMMKVIKYRISQEPTLKYVVPIMFLMNDLNGKTQITLRFIEEVMADSAVELFIFASGKFEITDEMKQKIPNIESRIKTNPDSESIKNYLELYSLGRRGMPIIISLPNDTQLDKVISSVYKPINVLPNLEHMTLIDEADEVYKDKFRNKILPYICLPNTTIPTSKNTGVYFTTASHDDFIEKYPEVQEAEQLPIVLDDIVKQYYRDIDHPDSINPVPTLRQQSEKKEGGIITRVAETNGKYAERIIRDHPDHFFGKVKDSYRNIIIHADFENSKQVDLAHILAALGIGSIVINQSGFRIIFPKINGQPELADISIKAKSMKGKQLNEQLYAMVNNPLHSSLKSAPLAMIGHKKIRRALTYHSAPRKETDLRCLLFTDIIVGHIEISALAVQVLGRLNGVIAHRPEYCGNLWYWVDQRTREMVLRQVRIVKNIEENSDIPFPIKILHKEASESVPEENLVDGRNISEIGPYNTPEECYRSLEGLLGRTIDLETTTVRAIEPSDTTPGTDGYVISTKLGQGTLRRDTLRKQHRIVLKRNSSENLPKMLSEIKKGNSVGPSTGNPNAQNYIILPVYDTDESPRDSYKYYARYEEPMLDTNGNHLFKNTSVRYMDGEYKIQSIVYSVDGIPTRAILNKLDGIPLIKVNNDPFINVNNSIEKCILLDGSKLTKSSHTTNA